MREAFLCISCSDVEFGEPGELYCELCRKPIEAEVERLRAEQAELRAAEHEKELRKLRRKSQRNLAKVFEGTFYAADIDAAADEVVKQARSTIFGKNGQLYIRDAKTKKDRLIANKTEWVLSLGRDDPGT